MIMMIRKVFLIVALAILASGAGLRAEEGMWIPMLIEKYKIGAMQEAGLKLSAEDIYSINRDCLKDAVVIFGRGCTGEMISGDGLLLTNHHCGEGAIQRHSSVENDYLTNGFWAMNREEELPNENLSVTFLRYIREVTEEVTAGTGSGMDPEERERQMKENQGRVIRESVSGTHYEGVVKPFYYGNAYYLFVYEVFRDVRLVGAPPDQIGNFGADQDNWMWPRHTGDFTLFRVYAGEDNLPAGYDPTNVPYRPRKHLEINAGGIEKGDFTMVLGYPGSTTQYLYSEAVKHTMERSLPAMIALRDARLEIMDRYMSQSDRIRIQYATKYRGVSNAWKKWQGMILGLNRNRVVEVKQEEEKVFSEWVRSDGERMMKYGSLLEDFQRLYREIEPYSVAEDMMSEAVNAVELFRFYSRISVMMRRGASPESLEARINQFYKDFHLPIDREIFPAMMEAYRSGLDPVFHPAFFAEVDRRYQGDFDRLAERLYKRTLFREKDEVIQLIDIYRRDPSKATDRLEKDPLAELAMQFSVVLMTRITPEFRRLEAEIDRIYRTYMTALMEQAGEKRLYPDANFTMRLTFGEIEGYEPRDGVQYTWQTTLEGVIEKSGEPFEDYRIPAKLSELYREKDYGRYGVNGTMPVCFIASNHTSGGNSGSPVLDAEGRLIGINFDRNWEGTMSDIYYDPSLCRNISVDIRYILFLVDKFAGAGYLLEEMDIVW